MAGCPHGQRRDIAARWRPLGGCCAPRAEKIYSAYSCRCGGEICTGCMPPLGMRTGSPLTAAGLAGLFLHWAAAGSVTPAAAETKRQNAAQRALPCKKANGVESGAPCRGLGGASARPARAGGK